MKLKKASDSVLREASPYLGLGVQLAAGVIVLYFVGTWADGKLHTTPWLMLTGVVIGIVGGFIQFFRTVAELGKSEPTQKDKEAK